MSITQITGGGYGAVLRRLMRRDLSVCQRGDTLVEVLVSMLIVSLVLTGAYVTTNRSTLAIRDSQERTEALKLVQGQLEQVRYNAGAAGAEVFSQADNAPFCMVDGNVVSATLEPGSAACIQNSAGQPTTDEPAYRLAVRRTDCAVGASCHTFTIRATWESITGSGQATEQISYRLHE